MHRTIECDVIVVGLGPSGLMATAYLVQNGWRVTAVEKHEALYGLPRAGHVDHEIIRFLQDLGEEARFLEDAVAVSSYRWYNAAGDLLLTVRWGDESESGYNSDFMMYQPMLEDALVKAIGRGGDNFQSLRGYSMTGFLQTADSVVVEASRCLSDQQMTLDADDTVTVTGAFLLAADGARSPTREMLGINRMDLGFNETWLDCDVRLNRPVPALDSNPYQICDPARPIFIAPLGKRHHRFEWAILPEEDPALFAKPETAWLLLSGQNVGPEDVEIVRQQVYTFEARVAERWREGRVFLLGDAAHTMPPQMGQGACSGMRDAVNLAWKLNLILNGVASIDLLDSYQVEREPHTRTWIELSIRTGEVSCTFDVRAAAERDALLLSGNAPPLPAFPDLTSGLLDKNAEGNPASTAGKLFPQRILKGINGVGLFDDVAGRGFLLITLEASPRAALNAAQLSYLERIGATFVTIADNVRENQYADITGFYRGWMTGLGIRGLVVRPDHYIYGAVGNLAELSRLVDALCADLGVIGFSCKATMSHG